MNECTRLISTVVDYVMKVFIAFIVPRRIYYARIDK